MQKKSQDTNNYFNVYALPISFSVPGTTGNIGRQGTIDTERAKREYPTPD